MAKPTKISVIIPNYNGQDLIASNLPFILKNFPRSEVIVVDDGSTDGSVEMIQKQFPNVKLIVSRKNIGFAHSVNLGVRSARGDTVVLLNSDVVVKKNYEAKIEQIFRSNPGTFAVGFEDRSHEGSKVILRGRGKGNFAKGLLVHSKATPIFGETLWASGGSSAVDRKKFLDLGGFDEIYSPFYWEDIDLSYRAWKRGWKVIFDPEFVVDHYHEEGAIKKNVSQFTVRRIAFRNQLIFFWKNIDDIGLIFKNFFWLPILLTISLFKFNWSVIFGFFSAIVLLPIILRVRSTRGDQVLGDKLVIKKFENL